MKTKTFFFLLFIASNFANAQLKVDTLTNAKIIQLSKIGLQSSVIINKIQTSVTLFDVSTDSIISMNNNGVSSDVINEMMKVVKSQQNSNEVQVNSKVPTEMHKSGIYFYKPDDTEEPLRKVDAFVVNYRTSSGGYGGYGGSSTTANLTGSESKLEIKNVSPVFYFYFDNSTKDQTDWYASSSPNEFLLVKLVVKKDSRLFKVGGSSSSFGSSSSNNMIPEKVKVQFDYNKVKEGIYKITFKTPLEAGEYCFVFANNTYKVFDFGIITDNVKK